VKKKGKRGGGEEVAIRGLVKRRTSPKLGKRLSHARVGKVEKIEREGKGGSRYAQGSILKKRERERGSNGGGAVRNLPRLPIRRPLRL